MHVHLEDVCARMRLKIVTSVQAEFGENIEFLYKFYVYGFLGELSNGYDCGRGTHSRRESVVSNIFFFFFSSLYRKYLMVGGTAQYRPISFGRGSKNQNFKSLDISCNLKWKIHSPSAVKTQKNNNKKKKTEK